MSNQGIRVLVVDDHAIVRRGIQALLETEADIDVVGDAADGHEAIEQALELKPDVVVLDLVMPGLDGIECIRELRNRGSEARILVLTSFSSDNKLFPALKAGALGYLLKDATPEELVRSVRLAARDETSLDPQIARRLLREFSGSGVSPDTVSGELLTSRELDVLKQLARGLPNEEIAGKLFISEATVRTHVSNILGKLGLSNRTQAALYALRTGIASIDEIENSAAPPR